MSTILTENEDFLQGIADAMHQRHVSRQEAQTQPAPARAPQARPAQARAPQAAPGDPGPQGEWLEGNFSGVNLRIHNVGSKKARYRAIYSQLFDGLRARGNLTQRQLNQAVNQAAMALLGVSIQHARTYTRTISQEHRAQHGIELG
jgi:hypothetical protein